MKYLLDTNICIYFFKGKFDLDAQIAHIGIENCAKSEITLAELLFGVENSAYPEKNLAIVEKIIKYVSIIPILDAIPLYAKEKVRLRKSGKMISNFDLFIGCTALVNDLIMVTDNVREFERIDNITIENWIKR